MRTVKEISDLTGISVRTLHYYDEIGLLKPTEKSEAGYRLYDDKALERLQQILQMQRKMLVAKKERMERLIFSIDDILKRSGWRIWLCYEATFTDKKRRRSYAGTGAILS